MKLAVIGSRHYTYEIEFFNVLDDYIGKYGVPQRIVTGCAGGADDLARRYATSRNIPLAVFSADWETYGKAAGPIRNTMIVEDSSRMIAFLRIDKMNRGSWDSIRKMVKLGRPVMIISR
jgi:hypothetical protein